MNVSIIPSEERRVSIEVNPAELIDLHQALTRKKRTKGDIRLLHAFAEQLERGDATLRRVVARPVKEFLPVAGGEPA